MQIAPPDAPTEEYPEGEVTIGEVNCELLSVKSNSDESLGKYRSVDGVLYPNIIAPLTTPSHLGTSVSTIRTNESPVLSRYHILHIYTHISSIQSLTSPTNPLINSFLRFFTPQIPETTHTIKDSPVRAFSWHNYNQIFAIALQNDTIYIYDLSVENWLPISLKHEFQHHISSLEWSPQSGTILAAACRYGICLWKIFYGTTTDKTNAYMTYLHYPGTAYLFLTALTLPGHSPVTTISWSPNGRFLASGSIADDAMIVWNVAQQSPTVMRRSGNISIVKYSPNGNYLFAATTYK